MIYFDNSSTTKISEKVLKEVLKSSQENFANASSMHRLGYKSEQKIIQSKKDIGKLIHANEDEIYFTSGATESNNLAIFGATKAYKRKGNKIITTKIEHPSVLKPFKELEKQGYNVIYLDVDNKGYINIEQLLNEVDENTIFISIIYVNNIVGTVQNIEEIAKKVKEKNKNVIFHTDAVQAFGKINLNVKNIDLLSASGHKIHSLKGIGFLYVRRGIRLEKQIFGAGQQNDLRSGTINNDGIISLASASKLAYENINEKYAKIKEIKDEIIKLKDLLNGVSINGDEKNGLPYILNISFEGIKGEVLLHALEDREIYVSTGSACSQKGKKELDTLDFIAKENSNSSIRISFCAENTLEEAKKFNEVILQIVPMLRIYQKR